MPATFSATKPGLSRALCYRPRPWGRLGPYLCSGAAVRRSSGGSGVSVRGFNFLPLDFASALGGALARRIGPFLCGYPYLKERPGVLVNLRQPGGVITSVCVPRAGDHGTAGQTEVEWEEVLFMAWGAEVPIPPGGLLSVQSCSSPSGRGRLTTRAMKAKLLRHASHYDWLALKGDRAAEEAAGL